MDTSCLLFIVGTILLDRSGFLYIISHLSFSEAACLMSNGFLCCKYKELSVLNNLSTIVSREIKLKQERL